MSVRTKVVRLRHAPRRWLEEQVAPKRKGDPSTFEYSLATQSSPLHRGLSGAEFPSGGESTNIRLAAQAINRTVIAPGEVFSYHFAVGKPSHSRGFRPGFELHDEKPALGLGGGACKVASLVYRLALWGGMRIVERHRHGLDLFPDRGRTVPFGCGATVYFNTADLRFENTLPYPVILLLDVSEDSVVGALQCGGDPGFNVEVYEEDHRFYVLDGVNMRSNRIRRRMTDSRGRVLFDREEAHNVARTLYTPELALPAE